MSRFLLSRWIHLIIFLVMFSIATYTKFSYPSLTDSPINTIGFIGFWLTFFGLLVAIIEVLRTGSITIKMAKVAEKSHKNLMQQIELQNIKECIEIINSALLNLNSNKAIPVIFLSRIKQGYMASFPKDSSPLPARYNENLNTLNTYQHTSPTRRRNKANPYYSEDQPSATEPAKNEHEHPYQATIDTLKRMHDDLTEHSVNRNQYKG